jgi:hypothetical protein
MLMYYYMKFMQNNYKNDKNIFDLYKSMKKNYNNILLFRNKIFLKKNKNFHINRMKSFTTLNKEWINSIYSYNKHICKFYTIKDKILYNIINSYFNLYDYNGQSKIKKNHNDNQIKFKKLSISKIFISRPEIKHTNYKTVITLYIYNNQKKFFFNKLINALIFNKLKERIKLIEEQNMEIINQVKKEKKLVNCSKVLENIFEIYEDKRYKDLIIKSLEKEIFIIYIKQLLHFNKSKFENTYLLTLNNILKKIYNKKIAFNIINIKYIHLNSNILIQSIILKLKKRKNFILKILKKFFKTIKISSLNKITLINLIENILTKKILKNVNFLKNKYKDNINKILFDTFSLNKKEDILNLENLILNSLKYKYINGLRLEAKGRLSKRRTASKSIFKFKYKGSLKNIDSSYKGLSTIMLRGYIKPNIQYTKLNSKTRNGSFGIKG